MIRYLMATTIALVAPAATAADLDFSYAYPPQAARIAPLRAWLEADRARLKAATTRDAAADRKAAEKDGYPFRDHDFDRTWQVVTDTPRFLSLSVTTYTFTGGAHGGTSSGSLLWDKAAGRRLDTVAVFTGPRALWTAIERPYCAALRAEQRKRDGAALSGGPFAKCPTLKELTLLLGSSGGGRIDRIGLIADQYVAGSYAEGIYEVTLPVTPAVLRAVKPAYRGAFAVR